MQLRGIIQAGIKGGEIVTKGFQRAGGLRASVNTFVREVEGVLEQETE